MRPAAVPVWARVGDCDRSDDAAPGPSHAFARPKSSTFTLPSGVSLTLAGLRSRWTIPLSWASSSASAICRATTTASSTGSGPRFKRSARSSPSASSMTRRWAFVPSSRVTLSKP